MNTPTNSTIRCRCGHQVLGREILRTEARLNRSGCPFVYLKYRCRRCKKLGEAFIADDQWNPMTLATPKNEMGPLERDRFLDEYAINSGDVVAWSRALQKIEMITELKRAVWPRFRRSRHQDVKTNDKS